MTVSTFQRPVISSDATFRAWGKAISDALTAFGITKTSDTGQINWTSVANPASAAGKAGYEIRQFTDALAATAPIFLKLEYASGASGGASGGFFFTVGTGSDGAGNITGTMGTAARVVAFGSGDPGTNLTYMSGDGGRFSIAEAPGHTDAALQSFFSIERTKDATGADTAAGVCLYAGSTVYYWRDQLCFRVPPSPGVELGPNCLTPTGPSSGAAGSDVATYGHHPANFGVFLPPKKEVLTYFKTDFAKLTQVQIPRYGGAALNYLVLGSLGAFYDPAFSRIANPQTGNYNEGANFTTKLGLLMRYE